MTGTIVHLEGLTRRFGKVIAVNGLDLRVNRGEIFGLLGPDGAGKTTTLRMMAAILDPTAGSARVLGFDSVKQDESIKEKIGYMAQQFSLYGDLSVMENISFYADIFGLKGQARRQRIDRLLQFARLTDFGQRRAAHLSGGMQKKLALACAMLHKPEIVLLDEPTTGVDPVSRREFWSILTELHLEGVTIIVSTPYMDEAERCSRVGLMYQGKLIVCDAPESIRAMVDGELLELRLSDGGVGVDQGLRRARAILSKMPGILEVQTYGDLIHAFVQDSAAAQVEITQALRQAGIAISGVRRATPRMEDAFISLVQRQDETDRDASESAVINSG